LKQYLKDFKPVLKLPYDTVKDDEELSYAGDYTAFEINSILKNAILEYCRKNEITAFVFLLPSILFYCHSIVTRMILL